MLRVINANNVEKLFSIVEGNKEIWTYLIAEIDLYK
ncbi:GNAT family acetyltransferase [Bacillus cereus]|nr:GNAT family acetyltransferase [Bacillus cereus]